MKLFDSNVKINNIKIRKQFFPASYLLTVLIIFIKSQSVAFCTLLSILSLNPFLGGAVENKGKDSNMLVKDDVLCKSA